jgi:hypothetical protein
MDITFENLQNQPGQSNYTRQIQPVWSVYAFMPAHKHHLCMYNCKIHIIHMYEHGACTVTARASMLADSVIWGGALWFLSVIKTIMTI